MTWKRLTAFPALPLYSLDTKVGANPKHNEESNPLLPDNRTKLIIYPSKLYLYN